MENLENKNYVDITIRKIFDMKMNQGHEMRKAFIDEVKFILQQSEFLKTFYFLKGTRVYVVDITSKKADELDFTKGKDVVYIGGNANMEYLLIVFKNGNIYAVDSNHNIKHIKNFLLNSLFIDKKGKGDSITMENFKLFASAPLDKIIIANDNIIAFWQKNDLIPGGGKGKKAKLNVEELNGTFYNISLENEKKSIISSSPGKGDYFESLTAIFNNNYFLGSYGRILYMIMTPTEYTNSYKVTFIDYLFKYENTNKIKQNLVHSTESSNEYVKNIEKRIVYSYINFMIKEPKDRRQFNNEKDRLILRFNQSGTACAIAINSQHNFHTTLMFLMTETYRITSQKMFPIYSKLRPGFMEDDSMVWIEDIDWVCNDLFTVVLFSQGYFCILNINFQVISFIENSGSYIDSSVEKISCPYHFNNPKLTNLDRLQLSSSKKRNDYFVINSSNYSICYQVNYKSYENKLILPSNQYSFDEFLYITKYFQLHYSDAENHGLFDNIHNFIVSWLKDLYNNENEKNVPSETISQIFNIFVKFIKIFRSINQSHETNLTIVSYLIGISNDFFYYLINYREIWLAFMFVNICENYLLKSLKLKIPRSKLCEEQMQKGQISYLAVNPYFIQNPSLKCYNRLVNKMFHSKMRLLIIFISLIEFRNNQGLTINVLHFVLAKLCLEKMKKHNLLDDIQLIVKSIIRNYKYLKSENAKVGNEEYILNSLTMNFRYELFGNYTFNRQSRDDIKFEFLNDFFPLEELQTFNEVNEMYCRGEDELLINEYNYINNMGVVQKWILFFTNFFYTFLYEDIKNYISNHLRQYVTQNKSADFVSPEENSLSSLIYFNLTFFTIAINNHLKYFLQIFTSKSDNSNEFPVVADNPAVLEEFSKIFMPFISPTDVPFVIFEFYISEDNKNKKTLGHEINIHLYDKLQQYSKFYNFNLIESFDFIEFLMNNGFKYYDDEMVETRDINRIQTFMYSAVLFYLFNIHKFSQIYTYEIDSAFIISIIDSLDLHLKRDLYQFLYLILNGQLKYYLKKEAAAKLSPTNTKYLEVVLHMLKMIFYKIVREEPFTVRRDIYEYVYISPSLIKPYLLEGALFYEYKNFNKYIKAKAFNCKNILDTRNYSEVNYKKVNNVFEELSKQNRSILFDCIFKPNERLTDIEEEELMKGYHRNFSYSISNLLLLMKLNNEKVNKIIFKLEENKEYIKKILTNTVNEKLKDPLMEDMYFNELIISNLEKVVTGNFDNKHFKFSNLELKSKLIRSIKLIVVKTLNLLNSIYTKFKMFNMLQPNTEIFNYLKNISFSLIWERDYRLAYNSTGQILDYLINMNSSELVSEKYNVISILINLNFVYIVLKRNPSGSKLQVLEEKVKRDFKDKDVLDKLQSFQDDLPTLQALWENLESFKSKNLKMFIMGCFNEMFLDNINNIYKQIDLFITGQVSKIPMRSAKKKYIKLADSYSNLTGIPNKHFIEFNMNWELVDTEMLYNLIINDEVPAETHREDTSRTTKGDSRQNIFMNRRQRFGNDTPRRRNVINIAQGDNMLVNNYVDPNSSFSSRCDTNRSVDLREESTRQVEQGKHNLCIKVKTKQNKNKVPKYQKVNPVEKDTKLKDSDKRIQNVKASDSNKNLDNIKIEEDTTDDNYQKLKELMNSITRIHFRRFKNEMFQLYKKSMKKKELEEIKIYSIKPKESIETISLKEKYVKIN
jgi:hypothetical protein